jgi:hypothetical protein
MQEIVTIHEIPIEAILEGDDNDASLYRDIMRWSLFRDVMQSDRMVALSQRIGKLESEAEQRRIFREACESEENSDLFSFRFTELGKWLLNNHQPFLKEYAGSHLPKSYRLHAKRNYIQSRLDTLVRANLIVKDGMVKSEKNNTDTPKYSFTVGGEFLGCLIEARNKNKPRTVEDEDIHLLASQELFDLLDIDLEENADSLSVLLRKFFTKCKEKEGMFEELINVWAYSIFSFYFPNQSSRLDVRQRLLTFPPSSPKIGKIFHESLKELDEQSQRSLLFQFKLDFESDYSEIRFYWRSKTLKDWEIMRYQNIQDYSKVTLLGYCEGGCELLYPFLMDIFKFIELPDLFKAKEMQDSDGLETIDPKTDCLRCGKQNSLRILRTWLDRILWTNKDDEPKIKKLEVYPW